MMIQINKNYEFKSNLTPRPNDHLNELENAIFDLITNIEFRSVRNVFQPKLEEDLKKVKSSGKVTVFADKIANMCEMPKEEYAKLINKNATKTYQKTTTPTKKKIDKETERFAKKLKLEIKMEQYADQSAYVILKDHKKNFNTKLSCRLINPVKSEIGIVSKLELEKINRAITNQIKCNQWHKT